MKDKSATLRNSLTNVSRRITTSSVGIDDEPIRLHQPSVGAHDTLAKKEAEHWLAEAEYWLAEANEWRELRKSPERVHGES